MPGLRTDPCARVLPARSSRPPLHRAGAGGVRHGAPTGTLPGFAGASMGAVFGRVRGSPIGCAPGSAVFPPESPQHTPSWQVAQRSQVCPAQQGMGLVLLARECAGRVCVESLEVEQEPAGQGEPVVLGIFGLVPGRDGQGTVGGDPSPRVGLVGR
jgi:hypothetical protein